MVSNIQEFLIPKLTHFWRERMARKSDDKEKEKKAESGDAETDLEKGNEVIKVDHLVNSR